MTREKPVEPPTERFQHGDVIEAERHPNEPGVYYKRVQTCSMLDRYLRMGVVDSRQHDAGQKLYSQWYRSGASPIVVGSYGARLSGRGDIEDWHLGPRIAFTQACKAVGDSADILLTVCCMGQSARDWARAKHMRESRGPELLRIGLNRLADHYQLP